MSIGTKTVPPTKNSESAQINSVYHDIRTKIQTYEIACDNFMQYMTSCSSCVHLLLLQTPDTSCDEDQVRMWVHRSPGIVHLETMSAMESKADEACNNQGEKIHAVSSYIIFSCTSRTVDNTPSLYTPVYTRAWFEGGILG